ncbi:Ger(x)C family spore germination protein [Clostridium sp. DL1XJH146]
MKKKLIILWLLVICIFLTSCNGYQDINSLAIILGISVDRLPTGEIIIGTQTAKISDQAEIQKSNYIIETGIGQSVFEASRNLVVDTDKQNYWPHIQTIIIGRSFAEKGIIPVLDFFTRDSQRRRLVNIVVAKEDGLSLLQNIAKDELNTSTELDVINKQTSRSAFGVNSTISEFIKDSSSISGVATLNKFVSTKSRRFTKSDKYLAPESILDGVAIFYKYKMVNSLSKKETRAYNMLKDNIDSFVIALNYENTNFTYEINNFITKLKPIIKDDKYIMDVNIFINSSIVEASGDLNLKDGILDIINEEFENYIYHECMKIFEKSKNEIKLDIFDFGSIFSRKYTDVLELTQDEWNEIFIDNVDIKIHVNVNNKYRGSTVELLKE